MAADDTTRRILNDLAGHLADCCMVALDQQNMPVPEGGKVHDALFELFCRSLELDQRVDVTSNTLEVIRMSERSESNVGLTDELDALKQLAVRSHYYCEDGWYSCPKADGGCYNDSMGDKCSCGADTHNAEVDRIYESLLERLASNKSQASF